MADLTAAILIACRAHEGQTDRAGSPYILHPLRVMLKFATDQAQIVSVLHDVVEDSDVSLEVLGHLGFSPTILEAIDALTRRSDETYEDFIDRLAPNELARAVKIQDLIDNLNVARLISVSKHDVDRLQRYVSALRRLESEL